MAEKKVLISWEELTALAEFRGDAEDWFDAQPAVHGIEKQMAYFTIGFVEAYAYSDKSDVNGARNALIQLSQLLGLTKEEAIGIIQRYYGSWDFKHADWSCYDNAAISKMETTAGVESEAKEDECNKCKVHIASGAIFCLKSGNLICVKCDEAENEESVN